MNELRILAVGAALSVAAVAAPVELPWLVDDLDGASVESDAPMLSMQARADGGEEGAPSDRYTVLSCPPVPETESARVWIARALHARVAEMDGISFWIRGAGHPEHVQVILRPTPLEGQPVRDYQSRVLLTNPLWHRVVLPLSEFYDPTTRGSYPILRFPREGPGQVRVGLQVDGPVEIPLEFALDSLGFTTRAEVERTLGWKSYVPPSHGFPPYLDRFEEELRWKASQGATMSLVELEDFPHPGFRRGLSVALPSATASVARTLEPRRACDYYEGFGMWVKGDGGDHVLELQLSGDGAAPYLFRVPLRGSEWKLVFAGFENFLRDQEDFELDDVEDVKLTLTFAAGGDESGGFTLGPIRLGYEK